MSAKRRAKRDLSAPPPRRGVVWAQNRRGNLLWLAGGATIAVAGVGGAVTLASGRQPGPVIDLNADTVTVDRPVVQLGRVPLNVVVPVAVRVLNQSRRVITLGKPVAEALEGC